MLPESKPDARRHMLALLKAHPPSPTDDAAALLQGSGLVPSSGFLAVYRPLKSEAQLGWLLDPSLRGRQVWARTKADASLEFVTWDGAAAWGADALGMQAPVGGNVVAPEEISLVCVPGLAVMRNGNRLGRGKGCYDRTLPTLPNALRVAVTSEIQLVEWLPTDALDCQLHVVVTRERLHRCG